MSRYSKALNISEQSVDFVKSKIAEYNMKFNFPESVNVEKVPYIKEASLQTGIFVHLKEAIESEMEDTVEFWEAIGDFCFENLNALVKDEVRQEILAICVEIIKTYRMKSVEVLKKVLDSFNSSSKRRYEYVAKKDGKAGLGSLFKKRKNEDAAAVSVTSQEAPEMKFYKNYIIPVTTLLSDILNSFIGAENLKLCEPTLRYVQVDSTNKSPAVTFGFDQPILVRGTVVTNKYKFIKVSDNDWKIIAARFKEQVSASNNLVNEILNFNLSLYSSKDKTIAVIDEYLQAPMDFAKIESNKNAYFFVFNHISLFWTENNPKIKTYINSGFMVPEKSKLGVVLASSGYMG